jgi:hypothetical protein
LRHSRTRASIIPGVDYDEEEFEDENYKDVEDNYEDVKDDDYNEDDEDGYDEMDANELADILQEQKQISSSTQNREQRSSFQRTSE